MSVSYFWHIQNIADREGDGEWEGDPTFRERPLRIPQLFRSRADVVAARVSEHILQRLLLWYIPTRLPNHDRELGLVIARPVLSHFRDADFLRVGPAERRSRFDEEDRVGRDWYLGFEGVVAVVEAEAADEGGFLDGDGGKELGDCHCLVGDEAVEDGSRDDFCFDLFLVDGCESEVWEGLGVDLAQVDLAIFLGDKANEMGPIGRHNCRGWAQLITTYVFLTFAAIKGIYQESELDWILNSLLHNLPGAACLVGQ